MKDNQAKSRLALAIRAVLWGMPVIVTSIATSAVYAANVYNIAIAPTTLDQALKQLAIQTATTISYDTTTLSKIKGVSLKGNYAVEEALNLLLKPSHFEAVKLNNGGYTIRSIEIRPENSTKVVVLEPIYTQAQSSNNTPASHDGHSTQLPTITVKAAHQNIANIGKTNQNIKEIPQSVTVISRERIDQQALKTLDDVLLQTTGVTREQLWLNNNYSARGLKIENVRYDGGGTSTLQDRDNNADLAQYESVSLLRGADGLFGAGEAGGVINLSSKRPKAETEVNSTVTLGRWNNYRAEIDGTGALNTDQTIQGRAVAVFQDQDFFYKPTHNRREMVYGALNFDFTPQTSLFTGASYQRDKTDAFNASLPRWQDGSDLYLPRDTTMGAPWGWMKRENVKLFANLQHEINDHWKTQLNIRHNIGDDGINTAEMEGAVNFDTHESQWWRNQSKTDFKETTLDLNLQGSFEIFNQQHDVILGIDHSNSKKDYKENWVYYADGDAFNRTPPPAWDYPAQPWTQDTSIKNSSSATYGSLRLHPVEDVAVILGGRYTFNDQIHMLKHEIEDNNISTISKNDYKEKKKFIPYYGLTYNILPSTTLYSSFAEIYKNQRNYIKDKNDSEGLEPLTGRNIEFGIKHEIMPDLLASIAYFNIKKEHEKVYKGWLAIDNSNSSCCYSATGTMKSKGVDFELNGKVTPEWDISFGYTYNQNENKENQDKPYDTFTPKNLLKLWTTYQLDHFVNGLEIGGGVTAQSKTYAMGWKQAFNPATNKFDGEWVQTEIVQPKYAVWSLRTAYDINPNWNIGLNINNIFDKRYYSTIGQPGYGSFYGEPRSFLVTLKARY